jgi:putative phosphoesterase
MRIAVLSDIHANALALEAAYSDIKKQKTDLTVFLGDLVMTGPRPSEAFNLLKEIKPFIWLQGNTDNWLEEINNEFIPKNDNEVFCKALRDYSFQYLNTNNIEEIISRPIKQEFVYGETLITFCHGSPTSFSQAILMNTDKEKLDTIISSTSARVICCGHTHIKTNIKYKNTSIINFGSISIPGNDYSKMARYGIIEIDNNDRVSFECKEVPFDIDMLFRDMKERQFPGLDRLKEKYSY